MLIVVIAVFVLLIGPLQARISNVENGNNAAAAELRTQKYPQKPTEMLRFLQTRRHERRITEETYSTAYHRSREEFPELSRDYGSLEAFRLTMNIDYVETFLETKLFLENEGIYLDENILGRSKDSAQVDPKTTYQLVPPLWVVRNIAILIKEHDLSITDDQTNTDAETDAETDVETDVETDEKALVEKPPANITILPMRTYNTKINLIPFMEEYPVKFSVIGSPKNLSSFLLALTGEGRFLPLEHIKVIKIDSKVPNRDRVKATMICSGFLPLIEGKTEGLKSLEEREKAYKYHRGA